MKAFSIITCFLLGFWACQSTEQDIYTSNTLEYDLFQGNENFEYSGKAFVRELKSGELEITLQLEGPTSVEPYYFLTHFHFGSYESVDAPLASLLNPIDIRTLESRTTLGLLSDGTKMTFERFKTFDGHIKVHLAPDGPEYNTILAVGNIGNNPNQAELFRMDAISICSPYGPENR